MLHKRFYPALKSLCEIGKARLARERISHPVTKEYHICLLRLEMLMHAPEIERARLLGWSVG
jgi:hypothetical protein